MAGMVTSCLGSKDVLLPETSGQTTHCLAMCLPFVLGRCGWMFRLTTGEKKDTVAVLGVLHKQVSDGGREGHSGRKDRVGGQDLLVSVDVGLLLCVLVSQPSVHEDSDLHRDQAACGRAKTGPFPPHLFLPKNNFTFFFSLSFFCVLF